uniref:Lysine demethylase 7A n=1 Tax=Scleropages formosus TaxID=113540 RepID=A0A8C9TFW7_SCLFO
MAAAPLYCVCRQPYDVSRFMIECDICKDWFHGSCVQVEEHQAVDIDVYHCPNCHVLHGPSLMKKRKNWHRHDYTEPDDRTRPVQAGTSVFVRELQARSFPSADEILVRMQGHQVTPKYLEKHSFLSPIMVPQLDGLGLKLPPPSFSIEDVEHYVGGDKIIDVIDVARQADSKIKLSEFVKYYYNPNRPKVLNVISLEFSDTKMAELVEVPDVARKMSWVENYWPDDSFFPKPFVQKYCLMGVEGSYTDFHIDFGGTSVWYHVLWGEKIFYLIKPTPGNLALYEAWSSSPNQSEMFFGDKVDKCYKCIVRQGTTLLIPTGWIHAVLTSQDCMAFGGNFLHNLNIGMQLRCYEMERRLKTPDLFKFPYFEAICWYVAKNLLETLKELREDNFQPPVYLMEGVKALTCALKSWLKREVEYEVPDHIKPNNLIKELTKEIRHQELSGGGSCKPMKSQGSGGVWSVTRSTAERGTRVHRMARRLRDHGASRTPSNLDILELHTREVLRRLEVAPFHEDTTLCSRVNGKFKKTSASSTATAGRGLDNDLRLVLCNGRIVRKRPPSPNTEEAIQGMLSMAGLLYPEVSSSQELWWSSPAYRSLDGGTHLVLPFMLDWNGHGIAEPCVTPPPRHVPYSQDELRPLKHLNKNCRARLSQQIQENKNFMDSQGNSSEAWSDNPQNTEISLLPPFHPSKRPASNPPPISNQATKGKRPKKGMATAKQRLGKILRINSHGRFFV